MMANSLIQSLMIILALALWTASVLFTWWLVYHSYAPRIKFSKNIHKSHGEKYCSRYYIEFQNVGKRTIFNGEFRASLFLKVRNRSDSSWQEIPIPVNRSGELISKVARVEPQEETQNCKKLKITFDTGFLKSSEFIQDDTLPLEDMLTLEAYIKASFSGYDMVTGSKKTFTSKKYKIHHIS